MRAMFFLLVFVVGAAADEYTAARDRQIAVDQQTRNELLKQTRMLEELSSATQLQAAQVNANALSAVSDFDAARKRSYDHVHRDWPCTLQENHPIHDAAKKILAHLIATDNPISRDPNAPWIVYFLAASQIGLVPAR